MPGSDPQAFVSLRDIARHLNLSHSTISRALRSDPRISAATREQVQSFARARGYHPDPMLAALASYRRQRQERPIQAELAWINGWPAPQQLRAYREFDAYWRGASAEAAERGFRLTEFVLDRRMNARRLAEVFHTRSIQGILLPPHGAVELAWEGFPWNAFSVVRFGHSVSKPSVHVVASNQLASGMLAFEKAWERGYRRIGLAVSAAASTRFGAGYLFARMKTPPAPSLPPLLLASPEQRIDRGQLTGWLRRHRPDAVLTDAPKLAPALLDAGLRVPDDIGVAAFSVLDGGVDAGIDQNSEEIGRAALQLLVSLVEHRSRGIPAIPRELLIDGRWVDGASLPAKEAVEDR